jgi:hypothetical protein
MHTLESERIQVTDLTELMEMFWDKGWTDGHPVVPPTEARVQEFLEYAELEPDQVVGTAHERDRVFTAEKIAINAVMAGCKPTYMPVVVAAVAAICDPDFKFNHIATLGSAWPMFVVNGPVVKDLSINHGMYLFGPAGYRANATIGRAVSLLLWNCAEARPDGIQRGQWGNPVRSTAVIAENEDDTPWDPLHVQLGFKPEESTVTALSQTPPSPYPVFVNATHPDWVCQVIGRSIAEASEFRKGTFLVIISPPYTQEFIKADWTKADIALAVADHCYRTVADLKRKGRWGRGAPLAPGYVGNPLQIEPGDEDKLVYLFRDQPEFNDLTFSPSELARKNQIYVIVGGGDAGNRCCFVQPYGVSTNPVTKAIKLPG